jgi:hypothetical protein
MNCDFKTIHCNIRYVVHTFLWTRFNLPEPVLERDFQTT